MPLHCPPHISQTGTHSAYASMDKKAKPYIPPTYPDMPQHSSSYPYKNPLKGPVLGHLPEGSKYSKNIYIQRTYTTGILTQTSTMTRYTLNPTCARMYAYVYIYINILCIYAFMYTSLHALPYPCKSLAWGPEYLPIYTLII